MLLSSGAICPALCRFPPAPACSLNLGLFCPEGIILQFGTFNFIPHLWVHYTRLSSFVWSFFLSSSSLISCPSFVSSVNFLIVDTSAAATSIYIVNMVGASTVPCRYDPRAITKFYCCQDKTNCLRRY